MRPFTENKHRFIVVDIAYPILLPAQRHMLDRIYSNTVNACIQPNFDCVFKILIRRSVLLIQIRQTKQRRINRMFPSIEFSPLIGNMIENTVRIITVCTYILPVSVKDTVVRLNHPVINRKRGVIRRKVDNDFDSFCMRRIDKFFKLFHRTKVLIRSKEITAPISVIRRTSI